MITNKDISIDSENGKITLNGNKYDLGTQGEIDTAVKDVYSVMGQLGAKNLINYPYYNPSGRTNNGITYTYDKDGIITANGSTANNQSSIELDGFSRGLILPSNKKYTLTCEKTNDNNKGFAVVYFKNADGTAKTVSTHAVYEDGTTRNANSDYVSLLYNNVDHTSVTFWVDTDTIYITQARISTNSGTITNAVLKPMLRLASDTDNTYQPFAMTNKQLTTALGAKQDALTFDTAPTENSTNPVTSGGVFDAFKKVGLSVVADSEALTANTPKDIDTGSSDGVYIVLVAQSAGLDLTELYVVKVTNYAGGTTVKPLLQTQTYASTVTATERSSEANGKITITSPVNCTCSVFKFKIF